MSPDELKPAKFRGIEVSARDLGLKAGRRRVRDTIPGRDGEVSEDLGRAAREYSIEFVCTGDDWKDLYDALVVAVEDPTPAEFEHPDGTILTVRPDATFDFRISTVGEATVKAVLIEETDNRIEAVEDAAAAVEEAADVSVTEAVDRFSKLFTAGFAAAEAINSVTGGILGAINTGKKVCAEIALQVQAIEQAISTLITTPLTAAEAFQDLYANITDWSTLTGALARYHTSEVSRTADYESVTDPEARAVIENVHELNLLCLSLIVSQSSTVANGTEYAAIDDAEIAVDTVGMLIETASHYIEAKQLAAFADLQSALVSSILDAGQQKPRLKDFSPPEIMSADEIAQYLYQDGGRAAEIIARNEIQHPGFVSPETVLRVLEV